MTRNGASQKQFDTLEFDLTQSIATWIWMDSTPRLNGTLRFEKANLIRANDTIERLDLTLNLSELSIQSELEKPLLDSVKSEIHALMGFRVDAPYMTIEVQSAGYVNDSTGTFQSFLTSVKSSTIDQTLPIPLEIKHSKTRKNINGRVQVELEKGHLDIALFLEMQNQEHLSQ